MIVIFKPNAERELVPVNVKTIATVFMLLLIFKTDGYTQRIRNVNLHFLQSEDPTTEKLNANIADFVLSLEGITKVYSIAKGKYLAGDYQRDVEESWGAYEFSIVTNKGALAIIVKPITEKDASDFEKASLIGAAPHPVLFIPSEYKTHLFIDGYIIYPRFEGQKLSKLCTGENGARVIKENSWIIEQLAVKSARLKHAGISYEDFFYYNTIVDLENKNIAVIDFGKRGCADPTIQIRSWFIPCIFYNDPELKNQALQIFNDSYQRELTKLQNADSAGRTDN